jgi:hypothetical protein
MNDNLKRVAKTGFIAKGTVYALTGILTFLAAFNIGGKKAGKEEVLMYLDQQPFGNALLLVIGLGMVCYSIWRMAQTFLDPENRGTSLKALGNRFAFFISGVIYLGFAYIAFKRVLGSTDTGGSAQNSPYLSTNLGLIILAIIGAGIVGKGLYQLSKVYKSNFINKFELESIIDEKRRKVIKNTAYMGLTSRGILFLIIGYFSIKAAVTVNPSEIKSTPEAFAFIESSTFGPYLLGMLAAGLVGYAIYMFMMGKYRVFKE